MHDAEARFKKVLSKHPLHPGALNLLAVALTQLGRFEEAERIVKLALKESAGSDATFYNYGIILKSLRRPEEALEQFSRALQINPNVADTWNNRGTVLNDLARYKEAVADFDRALSLTPNHVGARYNKGKSLAQLLLYEPALEAYGQALALKPDLAEAWLGRGNVFLETRRYDEAYIACDKAVSLDQNLKFALGARLQAKLQLCDWSNLASEVQTFTAATRARKLSSTPFTLLSALSSPMEQLIGTKRYLEEQPAFPAIWRGERYEHDRIRIAYLSPDLADHPVAQQLIGLLEHHDRARFELTAISFGPDSDSGLARRVRGSFDRFLDVRAQGDLEIAEQIRALEIDIAVDLCGYTQGCRLNILARRPAPVQVSYLGYSATMGTPHIDYLVADAMAVPRHHLEFFSESVVWLPDTLMVNDPKRVIAQRTPTRQECGLPDTGFVFCCFNNAYKILPDVFQIWMRLLKAIDNSVLWLGQGTSTAMANLRGEAEKAGIASKRVIFAPRVPDMADHLARLRQADLFLDTLPYNGHVTTSDALWTGLPVLTCLGSTLAGRVAASQLAAAGVPELIADASERYESIALGIARDDTLLRSLKERLSRDRTISPLFDARRFARHIESAFKTMHARHLNGQRPQGFAVEPLE